MASNSSDSPSDDGHHFATPPRPVFRPSLFSRVAARWDDLRLQPWPAGDDADPGATRSSSPPWARWGLVLILGAVAVGVGWWLLSPGPAPVERLMPAARRPVSSSSSSSSGLPTAGGSGSVPVAGVQSATSSSPVPLVVQAAGAVNQPGVYRLEVGARVDDLLRAAGGAGPEADLDRVNLAAPLSDGERLWVPRRGEPEIPTVVNGSAGSAPGTGSASGGDRSSRTGGSGGAVGPVNLNTATADELDALPGVGPATAAAILAHREEHGPFRAVDDLLDVRGIGEAKLEQLRPLVSV